MQRQCWEAVRVEGFLCGRQKRLARVLQDKLVLVEPTFAIYADEYGETGADLASRQQPVYVFLATLVPAGSSYLKLERELHRIAGELASTLGLEEGLTLHAVDLYQRKGSYRHARGGSGLGVAEAVRWFRSLLEAVSREAEAFAAVHVEKSTLAGLLGREPGVVGKITGMDLRRALFFFLLRELEVRLRETKGYGFVFFEQSHPRDAREFIEVLPFGALRRDGKLRVLGVPAPIGKRHLMAAAADFPAYVYGRHLKAERGWEPPRKEIRVWFREFVESRLFARDVTHEVFALLKNPASWEGLWVFP